MQTKETHYSLLGIPKDATEKEIKVAFKRLAKVLHPDVSTLPDAQERFQDTQKAYDVLKDEQARAAYDKQLDGGSLFEDSLFNAYDGKFRNFYASKADKRPINGRHMTVRHTFNIADVLTNKEVTLTFDHADRCVTCTGSGEVKSHGAEHCPHCQGKGFNVVNYSDPVAGKMTTTKQCEHCKGTGARQSDACPSCHGAKSQTVTKEVTFRIPQDACHGKQLRIQGAGGVAFFNGTPGDILITLERSSRDSAIVSDDGTVYFHLIIPPEHLFRKESLKIALPDQTVQAFDLPSNRPGTQIVIKGKGFGNKTGRGDLIYLVYPDLPKGMK